MDKEAVMMMLPQGMVPGTAILRFPHICFHMLQSFFLIPGKVFLKWEVMEWL